MNREALADRITNYCDALVAFSLVNALAFLIALAEPEIRCSIAEIGFFVAAVNLLFPVGISAALAGLARYQRSLVGVAEPDELIARFVRFAQLFRYALVWVFGLLVIVGVWASTYDSRCQLGLN
jgi:hypothetical protein